MFICRFIHLSPIRLLDVFGWSEASTGRRTTQTEKGRTYYPVAMGMRLTGHHTLVINTALWHSLLVSVGQMWFRVLIAWLALNVAYMIYINWPQIWYLWLPPVYILRAEHEDTWSKCRALRYDMVRSVCFDRNTWKVSVK